MIISLEKLLNNLTKWYNLFKIVVLEQWVLQYEGESQMKKRYFWGKNWRETKKRIPILRFLGTYLMILVIPISISFLFYSRALEIMYSSTNEENRDALRYASVVLNERIEEISVMANQLATNHFVNDFQSRTDPFGYPNSYSIIETRQNLPSYNATNEFVFNYFIFFHKSQLVMNNQMTYSYSQFYNLYMNVDQLSYQQWYDQVTEPTVGPVGLRQEESLTLLNGNEPVTTQAIPFYHPLLTHGGNDGFLLIYIPKKEISALLSSINLGGNGAIYIEDKSGNLITYLSQGPCNISDIQESVQRSLPNGQTLRNIVVDGEDMLVTTFQSSSYTYVAVQSQNIVLKKVNDLKVILQTILVVSGLVSIFVAYLFARRTAKPLQDIINNLPEDENRSGDIYSIIKSAMMEVKANNMELQKTLLDQIPYLKSSFLRRLIQGEIQSSQEARQIIASYIPTENYMYSILLICPDQYNTSVDTLDFAVTSTLTGMIEQTFAQVDENVVCCTLNEQQLAVMLCFRNCAEEEFKRQAEELVLQVQGRLPVNIVDSIVIAGGNIVKELIQLSDSYEKAQLAFGTKYTNKNSSIFWYKESGHLNYSYYFPSEIETRLVCGVKKGDIQSVEKGLEYLFQRNFVELQLSASMRKIFLYQLLGTLTKLNDQLAVDERTYQNTMREMEHLFTLGEKKQEKWILDAYRRLCEEMGKKVELHHESSISQQILEYIDAHFCEDTISLASIASHFEMNESYLSYFFKQRNGIKLSVYIENRRIDKAKELLSGTAWTISQIATQTGYLSSNSFCRAFKRVTGINASTYRAEINK